MSFCVTFGSQYARELHPRFSLAHPDGWVTIEAADYTDARSFAITLLGSAWCDIYDQGTFQDEFFPRGEIAHFVTPEAAAEVSHV